MRMKSGKALSIRIGKFWRSEEGIGTLEIVLIAAVLILVALLFKKWIIEFIHRLMDQAEGKADSIFD